MNRPIPPFYGVYLLRSRKTGKSYYIGSTPHPCRRLKQHNGKGGAVKLDKKPWDMIALVTGFPSQVAALQFEWAWQNPHLTRHIDHNDRATKAYLTTQLKSGKERKKWMCPTMGEPKRLQNLYLLLRSKSFSRWPLQIKFLDADLFSKWTKFVSKAPEKLRTGIRVSVSYDENAAPLSDEEPKPIGPFQIGYDEIKQQLNKSLNVLRDGSTHTCTICANDMKPEHELAITCPSSDCSMTSHLTCLSNHFLNQEGNADVVLPLGGKCPCCSEQLSWYDLMRDLSLRVRGLSEVNKIFKKPKRQQQEEGDNNAKALAADSNTDISRKDTQMTFSLQRPADDGLEEVKLTYFIDLDTSDADENGIDNDSFDESMIIKDSKQPNMGTLRSRKDSNTRKKSTSSKISDIESSERITKKATGSTKSKSRSKFEEIVLSGEP